MNPKTGGAPLAATTGSTLASPQEPVDSTTTDPICQTPPTSNPDEGYGSTKKPGTDDLLASGAGVVDSTPTSSRSPELGAGDCVTSIKLPPPQYVSPMELKYKEVGPMGGVQCMTVPPLLTAGGTPSYPDVAYIPNAAPNHVIADNGEYPLSSQQLTSGLQQHVLPVVQDPTAAALAKKCPDPSEWCAYQPYPPLGDYSGGQPHQYGVSADDVHSKYQQQQQNQHHQTHLQQQQQHQQHQHTIANHHYLDGGGGGGIADVTVGSASIGGTTGAGGYVISKPEAPVYGQYPVGYAGEAGYCYDDQQLLHQYAHTLDNNNTPLSYGGGGGGGGQNQYLATPTSASSSYQTGYHYGPAPSSTTPQSADNGSNPREYIPLNESYNELL